MIVYGIDPGLSGAIARFDLTEGFLEIHDMPIMEVNKKKSVSPQLVADILRQQHAPVYIEKVGAMPGQGVSSMFSFGRSYGVLLGCAAGLQMPTTVITPVEWQRALKCQKGKDGNRQRAWLVLYIFISIVILTNSTNKYLLNSPPIILFGLCDTLIYILLYLFLKISADLI